MPLAKKKSNSTFPRAPLADLVGVPIKPNVFVSPAQRKDGFGM